MATEVYTVNTGVLKHNGQPVAKRGDQINKRAFAEKVEMSEAQFVQLVQGGALVPFALPNDAVLNPPAKPAMEGEGRGRRGA